MATTLGKGNRRSSRSPEDSRQDDEQSGSFGRDAQEVFRRHFEAQFKPLPQVEKTVKGFEEEPDDESEEDPEWDGISDEEQTAVQIVEHTDQLSQITTMSKGELKSYMGSKPPTVTPKTPVIGNKSEVGAEDDDSSEAANLKKDLALQRLLTESHLLESATNPTLSGNNRHRATDLRLRTLGAKTSILKQEKMPMSHRKGMIAKQMQREEKRRREAKENGIILEKTNVSKKNSDVKRDRGVGAPGVGKFSGGTLKLSKKDISDIEEPRRSAFSKGGKGGKGRGGRHGR